MQRTLLLVVVGALVVGVGFLGYQYYLGQQKSGVEIGVGERGISIEVK